MDSPSIVESIYNDMRKRILKNEFSPNTCFVEQSIAQEYAASRGTARAALQLLCQAKFLVKMPRKGYFLYIISEQERQDITYARYHLELAGIELIIKNCTDAQINTLRDALVGPEHQTFPENTVNRQFHLAMAKLSGNRTIYELLGNLLDMSARDSLHKATSSITPSHLRIVEALLKRDLEKAGLALKHDMQN